MPPQGTAHVKCGRCKYIADVPDDLRPEYNTRECILVQSGSQPDSVCRKYLTQGANHPFHNVQHFGGNQ